MKTYANKIFQTKGADGLPNGRIIRVWERGEAILGYGPGQVYISTILPGRSKGPHLHMKRDSLFCCVRGTVRITVRTSVLSGSAPAEFARYEYQTITSGVGNAGEHPMAVHVPAGTPCQLYNCGGEEAMVVNVSSEPFNVQDEVELTDWRPNE